MKATFAGWTMVLVIGGVGSTPYTRHFALLRQNFPAREYIMENNIHILIFVFFRHQIFIFVDQNFHLIPKILTVQKVKVMLKLKKPPSGRANAIFIQNHLLFSLKTHITIWPDLPPPSLLLHLKCSVSTIELLAL